MTVAVMLTALLLAYAYISWRSGASSDALNEGEMHDMSEVLSAVKNPMTTEEKQLIFEHLGPVENPMTPEGKKAVLESLLSADLSDE